MTKDELIEREQRSMGRDIVPVAYEVLADEVHVLVYDVLPYDPEMFNRVQRRVAVAGGDGANSSLIVRHVEPEMAAADHKSWGVKS